MYLIFVYYHRTAVLPETPMSELWSTAKTLRSAKAVARRVSRQYPRDDFSVEGGTFEPGAWGNPVFRNGEQLR